MSAPWTLKSKVLVELQLAQHRITKAGCCISELLTEYAAEGNRTGCGPDDTYLRLYLEGKYVGWIQQVGDLRAELFVSSADGHTPRSQADHLDLVLRKAVAR